MKHIYSTKFVIFLITACWAMLLPEAARSQKKIMDWSSSELIGVQIKVGKNMVELSAGGQRIVFNGALFKLNADQPLLTNWKVTNAEVTTFTLNVEAKESTLLKQVSWFNGQWEPGLEKAVQSTKLMDNVIFLRKNGMSFFLSLDFPYSKIDADGIHYPPDLQLPAGGRYTAHSLSIGACRLSGEKVGSFDRAEIEAVSAYVEKRFKPRFDRPMVLSSGITNQMTDVREGRIFYSMYDNPTVALSPDLVEADLRLNAELGIEYYQAFEGVFDWPDGSETGQSMQRLQNIARNIGVRMGDYGVPQGLYCPHYNYAHRKLDKPEWMIKGTAGNVEGPECMGVKPYMDLLKSRLLEHNKQYGLQLICLDFLNIRPCYATNHNHPVGDTYQQILALVELLESLNAIDPEFLVWSNSGNWLDLMPKLFWYNPNVYLTDPHVRHYSSHLNVLKHLGDGRREQMVSVHESHFVPYRAFTNYEYYLSPDSRLADSKIFEYSFLQGLAVTPNIGLGEIRSFLDRIPAKDAKKNKAFIRHWLSFIKRNYEVWKHTSRLGDLPGIGAAEVYGHISKDKGFLCLVNQNSFTVSKTLKLDGSIGLTGTAGFLLDEVYPGKGPIAEQPIPYARRGDSVTFTMAPYTVRIIELKGREKLAGPGFYGISPKHVARTGSGYQAMISIPQGVQRNIGIVLPVTERITEISAKHAGIVPMYTFPASAKVIRQSGHLAYIEVTGPRAAAPRELSHWKINNDTALTVLPGADHKGFMGAVVHNAFSENYELVLDIQTGKNSKATDKVLMPGYNNEAKKQVSTPRSGTLSYTTQFVLPFIEQYGRERNVEEDPLIELVFDQPNEIQNISATINHKTVAVQQYRNPINGAFFTYYIPLNKNAAPGPIELRVTVTYSTSK